MPFFYLKTTRLTTPGIAFWFIIFATLPLYAQKEPVDRQKNTYSDALGGTFIRISGGTFVMGSGMEGDDEEKPKHTVTVSDFYLGAYEVTVEQFKQFIEATGYQTDASRDSFSYVFKSSTIERGYGVDWRCDASGKSRRKKDYNHPVIHVSWRDAKAYCDWLSLQTGEPYRLPTEAEFEYAAGNGEQHTTYSWGNSEPRGKYGGNVADETARNIKSDGSVFENYNDGYVFTAPVGTFNPNQLGLFDMSGNVGEWCNDWFSADYYKHKYPLNPQGPVEGVRRVYRGGSWHGYPRSCRVAQRQSNVPNYRIGTLGFRVARSAAD